MRPRTKADTHSITSDSTTKEDAGPGRQIPGRKENNMKAYKIKEEFLDRWGEGVPDGYIVTEAELERLASEWEIPVEELLEQLEEVD